jgi:hypothetical protein
MMPNKALKPTRFRYAPAAGLALRKAEPVYRVPPFGTGQDAGRILQA